MLKSAHYKRTHQVVEQVQFLVHMHMLEGRQLHQIAVLAFDVGKAKI